MASGKRPNIGGPAGNRKGDAARAERLRAALRENLKRRKAQARERSAERAAAEASHPDSAGIGVELAPGKSGD